MVEGRRPPKMKAEMGTPCGFSQSGSMVGHWLAGVVKRPLGWAAGVVLAGVQGLPRQSMRCSGDGVGHALPPDAAVGFAVGADGEGDVSEDGVAVERRHGVGVGLHRGARSYAEEACLGIDSAELAAGIGLDPCNVVAHRPDLPSLESGRGNEHGEVGLAAGGGEGGGEVGLLGVATGIGRCFNANDEHVFGHPSLVARNVGGDAQGEALLAQQGVAAIARAVGPDLARLRVVDDVLEVVTGPGNVLLSGLQRRAHGVHAGGDAMNILIDLGQDRQADARHDAHVDDDIGRVGELDADLRDWRTDRAHGERKDIHGASTHGAGEELFHPLAHDEGVFPVVGGAGVVLGEGTDEGAVLHARHIGGHGARVEAAGPLLVVEREEGAGLHQLVAQHLVLVLRAGDPVDVRRLGEFGHLFDPANEVSVGGRGSGGGPGRHGGVLIFLGIPFKSSLLGRYCQPDLAKRRQSQRVRTDP